MPGPQDTASTCRSHRRSAERCQKGEAHHDRDVTAGSGYSRTAGTAQPPLTIWTALRTRRIRYMLRTTSSLPPNTRLSTLVSGPTRSHSSRVLLDAPQIGYNRGRLQAIGFVTCTPADHTLHFVRATPATPRGEVSGPRRAPRGEPVRFVENQVPISAHRRQKGVQRLHVGAHPLRATRRHPAPHPTTELSGSHLPRGGS